MNKTLSKALILLSLSMLLLVSCNKNDSRLDKTYESQKKMNNSQNNTENMDKSNLEEVAKTYYNALYSSNFNKVKEVASPNLTFEDPTALPDYPEKVAGLDSLMKFFQESSSALNMKMKIIQSYTSNDRVVIFQEITGITAASTFGQDGDKIEYKMQGVTVIQVVGGLVVRHTDYMDYKGLFASFKPVK